MKNREFKFRVWDFKHKCFRNKNLHSNMDGISTCGRYLMRYTDHDSWPDGRGCAMDITDFAILQYTGLKDRNGKEIYEGDILVEKHDGGESEANIGQVYFAAGTFMINGDVPLYERTFSLTPNILKDYTVEGNIFENPELLK